MTKKNFRINILIPWLAILTSFITFLEFVNAAAYLQYDSYSWIQYSGNGDNGINPGEIIYLVVRIKNTGTTNAEGVIVSISVSDPYVSITTSPPNSYNPILYGTVNAGTTVGPPQNQYFCVSFATNTPGGRVVTFNLTMRDVYNNTWSSSFNLIVSPSGIDLKYDSYTWGEYSGNGDNAINPGEKIYLNVRIKNVGTSGTDGVYAELTTSDSYVKVYGGEAYYGSISSGTSKGATSGGYWYGDFKVDFATNTPAGHVVTFTLNIRDTYGNRWTDSFTITVVATGANLKYDSYTWKEYSGNGDNAINPGEKIYLNVRIKNVGTSGTDGVYAELTTSDSYVKVYYWGEAYYGSISSGTSKGATSGGYGYGDFKVDFAANTPAGHVVTFTLNIRDTYGNRWTDSFTIKVAGPPVAPSGFTGVAQSQTSILWIWTDNSDDETGFKILDEKNTTIISLPANTNSWLETGLLPNTRYTRYVKAYNSYGERNSNSASVYTLTNPPSNLQANGNLIESCVVLYWNGNKGSRFAIERALDLNGSPGTWQTIKSWNDNIVSETFIDTGLAPNTKYWYRVKGYNGDGIINDTPSNEVSATTLPGKAITSPKVVVYNNLVDPAKNQVVYIRCDLPQEKNVTVTVYDLAGRKIKTIIDNERKPAGVNIIEWDGRNADNEIVASGSYIVYIKAGSFVDKKKVLVVK